ncbi:cytochrome c oxidase subunit II [Blastopirellula sp. JC732]|uniref:Cytochrome c oxidase subunit 2 n=1 Tax=Blastopirellula sediminis TaxID=2894196 RepID=A0A9X1SHA7_9BACT|nr:cytochrome c oxidase subunit II [Blastopirellula sediminis]MCC9606464.1 cytochrome c oxidase subunit II [Blastopirellula sediminis]MCC9630238.1 cytochrome c oxidase subunit II [Blastopirellula sediminis]
MRELRKGRFRQTCYGMMRWPLALALVACCPLLATAQSPDMFNPSSPDAAEIRELFYLVLAISAIIFLLVGGALAYFIVRFRDPPGAPRDDTEPPQIYGSQPIEIAWTLAPTLIVFVLSLVVIRSVIAMRSDPPEAGVIRVRAVGHQWWWEFEYPDYGFTTANELVIPSSEVDAEKPVYLQLESADVIHSFWIPKLAGKTDLVPGQTNRMRLQADTPGLYEGRCAEYCGTQHARMLIRVNAVEMAEFEKWIENQKRPAVVAPGVEAGRQIFMDQACANCHTIRGEPAVGKFGPDLTHLMSRETIAAGVLENNRENLSDWLADPDHAKPGSRMPNMRLSPTEVKQLVDYLMTLE